MTTTTTPIPTNGVDRCPCGCKYWAKRIVGRKLTARCFDCGDRFHPEPTPQPTDVALDAQFIDSVEDVLIFQFDIDAGKANAIARAIVEALDSP